MYSPQIFYMIIPNPALLSYGQFFVSAQPRGAAKIRDFHEIGTFPLPDASNYGILKASTDADTIYYSVSKGA